LGFRKQATGNTEKATINWGEQQLTKQQHQCNGAMEMAATTIAKQKITQS